LATESGISQDVFDKMAPAFTKLKENMQSVYKTEEHLSRVSFIFIVFTLLVFVVVVG
jgi:hypothetical protein